MSVKKTKKTVKPTSIETPNFRARLYAGEQLDVLFNPITRNMDEPPKHADVVDFTIDPTNKTRKVLDDNAIALGFAYNAKLTVVDNLGYKPHMPNRTVAIHYGQGDTTHPRYRGDRDIIAGVFNVTEEQKMFNAAAIGIFKHVGIPLMVLGDPIKGLSDELQTDTRSIARFFRSVDMLLHPSPQNTFVSTTWALAAMAAGMAVVATKSYSLEPLKLAFGIRLVDNVISEWKNAADELAGVLATAQERNEKFALNMNEQGKLALSRLKQLL